MDTERELLSNELVRAVELLSDAFARRSIRHALIGGLATSMRSRPRLTQDVDFLVDVPQLVLPALLDDLIELGFSLDSAVVINQYVREHITAFYFGTVRIDWLKPVLPFYTRALAEAELLVWTEGHSVRVAAPEGLILTKMVAFRLQDQIDIETLLTANRETIDVTRIRDDWSPFAVAEPERHRLARIGHRQVGRAENVS